MRKRSSYRPRPVCTNPIAMAIEGAAITAAGQLDKLRMLELAAIDAFAHGQATRDDWRAIADLSNVAETMAGMGIGPEALEAVRAVEAALEDAHHRYTKTGRVGTTGPGLQAMRDLLEYHDLQRTSVDRSTYERAIKATANRIRSSHPSHKVLIA